MHKNGMLYALIRINNHVISYIISMISHLPTWMIASLLAIYYIISLESFFILWSYN